MEILGLDWIIWAILVVYFAGMLAMGWWSRRSASSREGYLLGGRRFGTSMMVMHAFGAGTNPSDTAGVVSKTVSGGASGIWASWMWMFGTPFYWLIAPIVRRMRCLTMADFFQERYGKAASALYCLVATVGMIVCLASVLLATTYTAQGMMGKVQAAGSLAIDWWFYGILIVTTITFIVYGYWGGIVAAIRTDMVQGIMIIVLSVLAIPAAMNLKEVGSLDGMRQALSAPGPNGVDYLGLFDPSWFSLPTVIVLCATAPLTALALPHLVSVCGAGRTEWEGRMGFAGGNLLKRICTIGWSLLALCWLAHLVRSGSPIHAQAAFGDAIRELLPSVLQGLMLACVLAAAMSSGDAFQVTVAGLFSENIYRVYIRPDADEKRLVHITRVAGIIIAVLSLMTAMLIPNIVKTIILYFSILALVGLSTAMGVLWRRMNSAGVFASVIPACAAFVAVRLIDGCPKPVIFGAPLAVGLVGGIVGSLVTRRPDQKVVERFFTKIHVPIGQDAKLDLPLEEAVPQNRRLLTAGGLFIVKPSRQTWVGFLVVLGICLGCVAAMLAILG